MPKLICLWHCYAFSSLFVKKKTDKLIHIIQRKKKVLKSGEADCNGSARWTDSLISTLDIWQSLGDAIVVVDIIVCFKEFLSKSQSWIIMFQLFPFASEAFF